MKFLNIIFCLLIFIMPACAQDTPKDNKVLPVDEGAKDPNFFVFRRDLIHALATQDSDFIKSMVSPEIRYSFGGEDGLEGFYDQVKLQDSNSSFYNTLMDVMLGGGSFVSEGRFCAPYTFNTDKIEDPFEEVIAIRGDVPIYDKITPDGAVIDHASFEILKRDVKDNTTDQDWVAVYTHKGNTGYVRSADVRSPVDYRACFVKNVEGAYQMDLFIAGD